MRADVRVMKQPVAPPSAEGAERPFIPGVRRSGAPHKPSSAAQTIIGLNDHSA